MQAPLSPIPRASWHLIASLGLVLPLLTCGDDAGDGKGGDGGSPEGDGGGGGPVIDASSDCEAPDMLLLIDRTMSMHRTPEGDRPIDNTPAGRATSKWAIAVNAIESVTSSLDSGIRFGLALFPIDPGGDACVTLEQRIAGAIADNQQCQGGELLVPPGIGSAAGIAAAIDVETTRLCDSTPIGAGLQSAKAELGAIQNPIRNQFVVLLTDGKDTCDDDLALAQVHAMADDSVHVYVIGFGGAGVDNGLLNDLSCAGGTATGFPATCTADGNGHYTATDRDGPALYQTADDAAQLVSTLEDFAGEVCCGCVD